jgi:hypothetical protein
VPTLSGVADPESHPNVRDVVDLRPEPWESWQQKRRIDTPAAALSTPLRVRAPRQQSTVCRLGLRLDIEWPPLPAAERIKFASERAVEETVAAACRTLAHRTSTRRRRLPPQTPTWLRTTSPDPNSLTTARNEFAKLLVS